VDFNFSLTQSNHIERIDVAPIHRFLSRASDTPAATKSCCLPRRCWSGARSIFSISLCPRP
jgi:hypothetical protein